MSGPMLCSRVHPTACPIQESFYKTHQIANTSVSRIQKEPLPTPSGVLLFFFTATRQHLDSFFLKERNKTKQRAGVLYYRGATALKQGLHNPISSSFSSVVHRVVKRRYRG